MPTIRASFPTTLQFDVELSRDFDLNVEYQVAQALYQQITALDETDAIDLLMEAITKVGEGKLTIQGGDNRR